MPAGKYLDDTSIDGSNDSPDVLGRQPFAQHIATVLSQVRHQSESSVVALVGPWGSGKTSVLKMTERELSGNPKSDWVVTWFNPWAYSDIESLLVGFFSELRQAMPEGKRWNTARQRLSSLGAAVTPLAGAAQFAGINGADIAKHVQKVIDSGLSATATHAQAERALSKHDRPILVILDDLDRLEADELLLVLKLVRMIGRLPNVYYLLSYDEQTLTDVLFDSAIVGKRGDRARDFLEKLVQVKLDLPVLRHYQRNQLLEAGFDHLAERHEVSLDEDQVERIRDGLRIHLLHRLSSPRSIRRLIGQLDAVLPMLRGEVDFADLFLLTWLRLEEPGAYQMLVDHRDAVVGARPSVTALLSETSRIKQERHDMVATWRSRLVHAGVDEAHCVDVERLIGCIFPAYAAEASGRRFTAQHPRGLASIRRAQNRHYFDRYFAFDVPGEDLRDAVVVQALSALARGDTSATSVATVREGLKENADLVIEKLQTFLPDSPEVTLPLLLLLRDVRGKMPSTTRLFGDPARLVQDFAMRSLMMRDTDTALEAISTVCGDLQGLDLMLPGLERLSRGAPTWDDADEGQTFPVWASDAVALGAGRLAQWFAKEGPAALSAPADAGMVRWYAWKRLDGPSAYGWLAQLGREARSVAPTLEAFVGESILMGTRRNVARLNAESYPADMLVGALGEEVVRAAVADWADAQSLPERLENTQENRRLIAATHVRRFLHEHVESETDLGGDDAER